MLFKRENYQIKPNSMGFYQDLEHLDGLGISAISANLYENKKRDDLVIFILERAHHVLLFTLNQILNQKILNGT